MAAALCVAMPAQANDISNLAEYARARVADASGELDTAARGYAAALAGVPFDEELATRAYRRAVAAGDRPLALQAAQNLREGGALPPDAQFLFLAEAMQEGDWSEAKRIRDRIEEDALFDAVVPLLDAWIAYGSGEGDPVAILRAASADGDTAYADEHNALLLLATGRYDEGIAAVEALGAPDSARILRLRLAAAAILADHRRRNEALELISADNRAFGRARARLERRRDIPGAVDSASAGMAEMLIRISAEINRRNVPTLALSLSRYASMFAPDNAVAWLVTSAILEAEEQYGTAIEALERIDVNDPFYADALDARARLLAESGEEEAALAVALQNADGRDVSAADWQRLGELYTSLDRHDDAADAYGEAIEELGEDAAPWSAWLLYGGALVDAGRWDAAKEALDRSVTEAEDEAIALNYYGYALLERREELDRAEELITRASELQPNSASITDSLGWVYYVRGDVDRAIPVLERAALGDPDEPTINEHLGDAYWVAGRRREARFAWQAALVTAEDEAAERLRAKMDIGLTVATQSP